MLNLDSRSFLGVCEVYARLHNPVLGLKGPGFALTGPPIAEPFARVIYINSGPVTRLFCSFINMYE